MIEIVKDFFLSYFKEIIAGLLSNFIIFAFVVFFWKPKIRISKKIALGINYSEFSEEKGGEVAWKFKIVNKSVFARLYDLDIALVGIRYIFDNEKKRKTEHRKKIEHLAGVRCLERGIPKPIFKIITHYKPGYIADFAYRPLTYINLEKLKIQNGEKGENKFDAFELSILYTDSLLGRRHFVKRIFNTLEIEKGEFSLDGELNNIIHKEIPDVAWKNHEKRESGRQEEEKKLKEKRSDENRFFNIGFTAFWR